MTYHSDIFSTPHPTRRASGGTSHCEHPHDPTRFELTTAASPKRPSPLSNALDSSKHQTSRPRPIPLTTSEQHETPTTPTSQPVPSTSPSPPLSRSHPLLGSYSLSLLHARMSYAHAPHSISPTPTTGFSLHIGALGKGRSCPPELRCPAHEVVPFSATYYDLQDAGRTTQSPWVGTVDLDQHYYSKYGPSSDADPGPPPRYPGYRVAPVGQLQILVKTPTVPLKVFLVPYDLRKIPIGGRLLAREQTFVHSGEADTPRGGKLRYSFQLQFHCVPVDQSTSLRRNTPNTIAGKLHGDSEAKEFYLSRSIRMVFTSTPPERHEVTRTERQDEVVIPSDEAREELLRGKILTSPPSLSSSRRTSFGSAGREDWNVVRQKWLARQEVAKEMSLSLEIEPISRPMTPPVSLLSAQPFVPASITASSSDKSQLLQPRPNTPSGRMSPQPTSSSIRTPPSQRYPSNRGKKRRGSSSVEERELSEKLRGMDVDNGE